VNPLVVDPGGDHGHDLREGRLGLGYGLLHLRKKKKKKSNEKTEKRVPRKFQEGGRDGGEVARRKATRERNEPEGSAEEQWIRRGLGI